MPLNQQDKDELAALGIFEEAPPDDWVYKQGTAFLVTPSQPASSATPSSPPEQAPPSDGLAARQTFRSPPISPVPPSEATPET
jgi:hypothetical protein